MQKLLLGAVALLCLPTLHAQVVEVYGTLSIPRVSVVPAATNGTTSTYWAPGVGGGVTFNVLPIGPVRLGADLRGSTKPNANGLSTVLGGPKLSFKLPGIALKPYVEAAGGYVRTNRTLGSPFPSGSTFSSSYAGYELLAGADTSLAPFLNLRILEVGGGKAYEIRGNRNTTLNLFTLSSGLVLHF